ncbi:hypothetical protein [Ralstonia solanacearum]|uniref:hypothetical protein n=1 Tax=Ralstonia solanacearum TaxID=305 RepID=UPI000E57A0A4|nr:hypothetical protein [Ralstonia solanacearum]AXW22532.1 hypothetical protein CJO86_02430 [Ralstonia solanacearum]
MDDYEDLLVLQQWLRERIPLAESIRVLDAHALSEWELVPATCHANAERWIARFPNFKRVRGWAVEGGSEYGAVLHAHSVVQDETGILWDVTLDRALGFIVFPGPDATFDANTASGNWVQICLLPW